MRLSPFPFIFLDDHPLECAGVQANAPEVLTFGLPAPGQIPRLLAHPMGRGVGHRMLPALGEIARARRCAAVEVPYHPHPRSQPARDFLRGLEAPAPTPPPSITAIPYGVGPPWGPGASISSRSRCGPHHRGGSGCAGSGSAAAGQPGQGRRHQLNGRCLA